MIHRAAAPAGRVHTCALRAGKGGYRSRRQLDRIGRRGGLFGRGDAGDAQTQGERRRR